MNFRQIVIPILVTLLGVAAAVILRQRWPRIIIGWIQGLKKYSGELVITAANADPAWASGKHVPQGGDVKLVITERDPH